MNADRVVNVIDLSAVAGALNADPNIFGFDVNKDGVVNVLDLVLITQRLNDICG